jgi:hypothetical protein
MCHAGHDCDWGSCEQLVRYDGTHGLSFQDMKFDFREEHDVRDALIELLNFQIGFIGIWEFDSFS